MYACLYPPFLSSHIWLTHDTHKNSYLSLFDPSIREYLIIVVWLYKCWVCNEYLAGGHCHRFISTTLLCCSLFSLIAAHPSKHTSCWCCGTPPPVFHLLATIRSNHTGPYLGNALSTLESSDNSWENQPL